MKHLGILAFFIVGALAGIWLGGSERDPKLKPHVSVNGYFISTQWRYETHPYSAGPDGSLTYYHGFTVTANPISDKPYSQEADGSVIFYHGK